MIRYDSFSTQPLRQGQTPLCMLCSYASALYPFVKIPELSILEECAAFAGVQLSEPLKMIIALGDCLNVPRDGISGYDWLEVVHYNCPTPGLNTARNAVEFQRIAKIDELETKLRDHRASSIVSLSFTSARQPHSVAVAFDKEHGFFVRDSSAAQSLGNLPCVDAIGATIQSAILELDGSAMLGEAILIVEKTRPMPIPQQEGIQ